MFDLGLILGISRFIFSLAFLIIAFGSLFGMIFVRNYWRKFFLLAMAYNCLIIFILYQFFVRGVLGDLFDIIPIIFLNFIFTFGTGFGIVSNLIKNKRDLK